MKLFVLIFLIFSLISCWNQNTTTQDVNTNQTANTENDITSWDNDNKIEKLNGSWATHNSQETIGDLKIEIQELNKEIRVLEESIKVSEVQYAILLDKINDYEEEVRIKIENQYKIDPRNIREEYNDWVLFMNNLWNWVTVERNRNNVIFRFNGKKIAHVSDIDLYYMYLDNNINIEYIWEKVDHFIKNAISFDWTILEIKKTFYEKGAIETPMYRFLIDKKNWYYYDINFNMGADYEATDWESHFVYMRWQAWNWLYQLTWWETIRTTFCPEWLVVSMYTEWSFKVKDDGTYEYKCD